MLICSNQGLAIRSSRERELKLKMNSPDILSNNQYSLTTEANFKRCPLKKFVSICLTRWPLENNYWIWHYTSKFPWTFASRGGVTSLSEAPRPPLRWRPAVETTRWESAIKQPNKQHLYVCVIPSVFWLNSSSDSSSSTSLYPSSS